MPPSNKDSYDDMGHTQIIQDRSETAECEHLEMETSLAYPRERQEASVAGERVAGDEVGMVDRG